jgi:hypothetical protein
MVWEDQPNPENTKELVGEGRKEAGSRKTKTNGGFEMQTSGTLFIEREARRQVVSIAISRM